MYLPHNLPLCRPHVAMWIGASGKRYDFAVCRPGTICVDEPAVYILTRHEEQVTTPLFVGHTSSLHRRFGISSSPCPEEWTRALAIGMTHVHLRFDTSPKMTREAEVSDLVAALRPALNDQPMQDEERNSPALDTSRRAAAGIGRELAVHSREGSGAFDDAPAPALATVSAGWTSSGSHGFPRPPLFRADPAREEDGDPEEFEAVDTPFFMPPPVEDEPDVQPASGPFDEDREVIRIASPEPAGIAEGQHWPEMHVPLSAAPGGIEVEAASRGRAVGLRSFLRRMRQLIARKHALRRPGALDAGSAEPRSGPPAALFQPVALVEADAEPAAGTQTALVVEADGLTERGARTEPSANLNAASGETLADQTQEPAATQQEPVPSTKPGEASEDASSRHAARIAADARCAAQREAKRALDLDAAAPVGLFAGNISYEAGADILLEAIVTVCCAGDHQAQFLFAGDGAMRGDLQARAARVGLERRCRFLGDVAANDFDRVLSACDFVVIPGRVPQGEDLARLVVAHRKPVLTTHQAGVGVVVHGQNGLVTYDNPGSLVWGIRELLGSVYLDLRRESA